MLSQTLVTLALAASSSAHFILQWPPTAGFDDDAEPTAPCGGATVQVNSSSPQVQVDRFAISIFSSHPAGTWQFRVRGIWDIAVMSPILLIPAAGTRMLIAWF